MADELVEEVFTLQDGRAVTLRPMRPQDAEPTGRFVEQGLSPSSRRWRFHPATRSKGPAQLAALTRLDQDCHVALVAEFDATPGHADHARLSVAEARDVVEVPGDQAELALAVADAWQGQGLGAALLDRLCRHGGQRRLRRLRADVMADNAPMLALLRSRAARLARHPDDATLRQLWLPVGDDPPSWRWGVATRRRSKACLGSNAGAHGHERIVGAGRSPAITATATARCTHTWSGGAGIG